MGSSPDHPDPFHLCVCLCARAHACLHVCLHACQHVCLSVSVPWRFQNAPYQSWALYSLGWVGIKPLHFNGCPSASWRPTVYTSSSLPMRVSSGNSPVLLGTLRSEWSPSLNPFPPPISLPALFLLQLGWGPLLPTNFVTLVCLSPFFNWRPFWY